MRGGFTIHRHQAGRGRRAAMWVALLAAALAALVSALAEGGRAGPEAEPAVRAESSAPSLLSRHPVVSGDVPCGQKTPSEGRAVTTWEVLF